MRPLHLRPAALLSAFLLCAASARTADEIGVAHLTFEKSAKLKKIRATLFLSFRPDEERVLRCGVMARGRSGAIPVAGSLSLRLIGASAGGAEVWQSGTVSSALDDHGDARFAGEEVAGLAADAAGGTDIRLVRVDFKGGRGGRATELTVDCLHEASGS